MTDYFTGKDEVLSNKLGIKDKELLENAEADIVFIRLAELGYRPLQGDFDFAHLKRIHKHLFSDIYPFAGKVRKKDIAKEGSVFCYTKFIEPTQKEIFKKLKDNNYLVGLEREEFAQMLAELSADLNALHPFREGNGRTIRFFLTQVAKNAGFEIAFENIEKQELIAADIKAFTGDILPLIKLYKSAITKSEDWEL